MVNYWFNNPYLPRWLGVATILENVVLSTIVMAMMSTAFAPSWRGTWMQMIKAQMGTMRWSVDTQSRGGHRCPLAVRVAPNTRAIGSGGAQPEPERVRLDGHAS